MSTVEVTVTVDGEAIPAADLTWLFYAKCGCLEGVSVAKDRNGQLVTDEEAAFKQHYWTAEEARDAKRRGVVAQLGKRSDIPRPWTDCGHHPKWGDQ